MCCSQIRKTFLGFLHRSIFFFLPIKSQIHCKHENSQDWGSKIFLLNLQHCICHSQAPTSVRVPDQDCDVHSLWARQSKGRWINQSDVTNISGTPTHSFSSSQLHFHTERWLWRFGNTKSGSVVMHMKPCIFKNAAALFCNWWQEISSPILLQILWYS